MEKNTFIVRVALIANFNKPIFDGKQSGWIITESNHFFVHPNDLEYFKIIFNNDNNISNNLDKRINTERWTTFELTEDVYALLKLYPIL